MGCAGLNGCLYGSYAGGVEATKDGGQHHDVVRSSTCSDEIAGLHGLGCAVDPRDVEILQSHIGCTSTQCFGRGHHFGFCGIRILFAIGSASEMRVTDHEDIGGSRE